MRASRHQWLGGLAALLLLHVSALAGPQQQADAIPHVDQAARDGYLDYSAASGHRAFAIAPGGAWSWVAEQASPQAASNAAVAACQQRTAQSCVLYAVDDRVVFEAARWPLLWQRFSSRQPDRLRSGRRPGERMHDLRFHDRLGAARQLSEFRGKVLVLHFWGSWCPPCMAEFPQLQALQRQLSADPDSNIELVLLQVREPIDTARAWAAEQGFDDLPLYDSGSGHADDQWLQLAGGETLPDRYLAPVFPTSYVLDPDGVVLFMRSGAIHDWQEYLPFLNVAALPSPLKALAADPVAATSGAPRQGAGG